MMTDEEYVALVGAWNESKRGHNAAILEFQRATKFVEDWRAEEAKQRERLYAAEAERVKERENVKPPFWINDKSSTHWEIIGSDGRVWRFVEKTADADNRAVAENILNRYLTEAKLQRGQNDQENV